MFLIWLRGFSSVPSDHTPIYYLLSAEAQVLAAILALVFTLSLVAAQLATRYSHRAFTHILGAWVLVYLVLYLLGIALPLFLLMGNFTLWGVRLALMLGILCLLLLIPYFLVLRRRMSVGNIIDALELEAKVQYRGILNYYARRALENLKTPPGFYDVPDAVETLDNIAMGALSARDYDTFGWALAALSGIGESICASQFPVETKTLPAHSHTSRLEQINRRVAGDLTALQKTSRALTRMGEAATEAGLVTIALGIVMDLYEAGENAMSKERLSGQILTSIVEIAVAATGSGYTPLAQFATDSVRSLIKVSLSKGTVEPVANSVHFALWEWATKAWTKAPRGSLCEMVSNVLQDFEASPPARAILREGAEMRRTVATQLNDQAFARALQEFLLWHQSRAKQSSHA
ncbi:MAG: hypothetical protein HYX97_07595 [Chloroflexi bacterium]|nr:hypothetical protein [Chloroflexota bacterium]